MSIYKTPSSIGRQAEIQACQFLKQQGLKLLTQNYRCFRGEIDLIMQDQQVIAFIEVRYRRTQDWGGALESINLSKQKKLKETAIYFLKKQKWLDIRPCRFDILSIESIDQNIVTHWIKDAF